MDLQKALLSEVATARKQFISAVSGLTPSQAQFKPSPDVWSVVDNAEHMVWAEMGGINGIWKTFRALKANQPLWTGEAIHHGLGIEVIIEKTWQPKEQVPEVAKPRWGGPLEYWLLALQNCQPLLESLMQELKGEDLEQIIYPHIISGPLNVVQRMEFLRFHLNRHQRQIENLKMHPSFPAI
ncbi:MAG TPA: DinB family protein [Cyclobacteriaceae bacterium]